MRGWLRAIPSITALTAQRQYFDAPRSDDPTTPYIVLYRVGGLSDWHFQEYPDFILECWGENKTEASDLGVVVATEIQKLEYARPLTIGNTKVVGGTVNSGPLPFGGSGKAKRYRLDVSMHMRRV